MRHALHSLPIRTCPFEREARRLQSSFVRFKYLPPQQFEFVDCSKSMSRFLADFFLLLARLDNIWSSFQIPVHQWRIDQRTALGNTRERGCRYS